MKSNVNLFEARILVVDDEPFQRQLLRDVLKKVGFGAVADVDSSAAAISLLELQRFALVLSDIEMPGMNGLELLRQVRTGQTGAPRDIRFIILTSHSDIEVLSAAMALDINGFIVKPFKIALIVKKIGRALSEQVILRSDTVYSSVVTDLDSLRKTRHKMMPNHTDHPAPAAPRDQLQRQLVKPLGELSVGMRVAKNIKTKDGNVIIAAQTILTEFIINRLTDLDELLADTVVTVYNRDAVSKVQR